MYFTLANSWSQVGLPPSQAAVICGLAVFSPLGNPASETGAVSPACSLPDGPALSSP